MDFKNTIVLRGAEGGFCVSGKKFRDISSSPQDPDLVSGKDYSLN